MLFYWSENPPGLTEEDDAWFAEAVYTAAARRGGDEDDGTT